MATKSGLLGTAYHEAGHAIVAYELGFPPKSVSIIPDEDTTAAFYIKAL